MENIIQRKMRERERERERYLKVNVPLLLEVFILGKLIFKFFINIKLALFKSSPSNFPLWIIQFLVHTN